MIRLMVPDGTGFFGDSPQERRVTMELERSTALVTGASRGIGRELARQLAADGCNLVLVGRDRAALDELAQALGAQHGVTVRCEAIDLSVPGAVETLWSRIASASIEVDILVNNAGSGFYGNVHDQDPAALERMLQLNVVALATLTRLALPAMVSRRRGRILNVGSLVGYQPAGPRMAAYYASKAFVESFSRGLAAELEESGVTVTTLSPGPTESSFEERSGAARSNVYHYLPKADPSRVARAGIEGMKAGAASVIPGLLTKLLAFAGRLSPRSIGVAVNRILLKEAKQ
jgi:short-subunit dehydrogenase